MPNENQQTVSVSQSVSDDLAALIENAEQTKQAETLIASAIAGPPPATHHCDHVALANRHCPTCDLPFCPDCASPLDPTYCKLCLPEPDAELKVLPLIDSDGEAHEGRLLVPAKGSVYTPLRFATLTKCISDMSDDELEAYIQRYKDLIIQAEKALDFRRVVLGASQLEQGQRTDAKRRKLRADKTKYQIKTVTVDPKSGQKKTATTSVASATQMSKMMEALAALRALNELKKKSEVKEVTGDSLHEKRPAPPEEKP